MTRPRDVAFLIALGGAGLGACATKSDLQQVQADISLFKAESARRDSARAVQLGEVIRMQRALFDSLRTTGQAVGRLKGDLATDLYNIQQQLVQLQELTGQSQQRLTELRTQLEAREAQMRTTPAPSDATVPAGTASADQMYEASISQLRRGSKTTARLGLQELLRTHPTSERAPDALYYIGESFEGEQPDSSEMYYQRVVDQHPTSSRAPAALYHIGLLLERRKETARARRTYQRVVDQYPKSDEADLARDKLKAPGR